MGRDIELIMWGATGHAKVLCEAIQDKNVILKALFDNDRDVINPFPNVDFYYGKDGFEKWVTERKNAGYFAIAIGGERGHDRVKLHNFLKTYNLKPVTITHPTSFIAYNAKIGEGCQVLAQAAVCAEVELGEQCIINTGATVDHECVLGKGVHIAPGAHLAGLVEVGDYSTIYTGATVIPRIKIGRRVVVGAGAVVLEDIPDNAIVVGNPARILKYRDQER